MSTIRYVHRDYSPGNVYVILGKRPEDAVLKVGDIEYAKLMDPTSPAIIHKQDVRTVSGALPRQRNTNLL
jgi:hypothetical protein